MAYARSSSSRFYIYWTTDQYGDDQQLMIDAGDVNARVSYTLCKDHPLKLAELFARTPTEMTELTDIFQQFVADVDAAE